MLTSLILNYIGTPVKLDEAKSCKMLANILYDDKEWNNSLILDEKPTLENIEKFLNSSIDRADIPSHCIDKDITLAFGILLKLDKNYAYTTYKLIINQGEVTYSKGLSKSNAFFDRMDNFENWSSYTQPNNKSPQINENGDFI